MYDYLDSFKVWIFIEICLWHIIDTSGISKTSEITMTSGMTSGTKMTSEKTLLGMIALASLKSTVHTLKLIFI